MTDLELLELLLGDREEDVGRVGVGSRSLRHLEPIFKEGVVVEELTPEGPRLLDPTGTINHRAKDVYGKTQIQQIRENLHTPFIKVEN